MYIEKVIKVAKQELLQAPGLGLRVRVRVWPSRSCCRHQA